MVNYRKTPVLYYNGESRGVFFFLEGGVSFYFILFFFFTDEHFMNAKTVKLFLQYCPACISTETKCVDYGHFPSW